MHCWIQQCTVGAEVVAIPDVVEYIPDEKSKSTSLRVHYYEAY